MSAMYLLMSLLPDNCKLFLLVAFELYYHGICIYALIYSSGSESDIKTSSNVPPEKQNTYLVLESAVRICSSPALSSVYILWQSQYQN